MPGAGRPFEGEPSPREVPASPYRDVQAPSQVRAAPFEGELSPCEVQASPWQVLEVPLQVQPAPFEGRLSPGRYRPPPRRYRHAEESDSYWEEGERYNRNRETTLPP